MRSRDPSTLAVGIRTTGLAIAHHQVREHRAPGYGARAYNRIYAERLSKALNVPVIIENRPGVAGNLRSDVVAKAPPDGYTLLYTVSSSFTVNPWHLLQADLRPREGVSARLAVAVAGCFIVANNDTPFKTVKELVDYATANPGKLAYGTNGVGSFLHLIMELLTRARKCRCRTFRTKALHIDVVSARSRCVSEPAASAIPMINSGKVRAIAFSGPRRHAQFPNVPTIAEPTPALPYVGWHGIWAPAGVPNEVVQKLNAEVTRITQTPEVPKADRRNGQRAKSATVDTMTDDMMRQEEAAGATWSRQRKLPSTDPRRNHASQLSRPVHLPGKRRPERPAGICATHRLRDA